MAQPDRVPEQMREKFNSITNKADAFCKHTVK